VYTLITLKFKELLKVGNLERRKKYSSSEKWFGVCFFKF